MTPELMLAGGILTGGGALALYTRPSMAVLLTAGLRVRVGDARTGQTVALAGTLEADGVLIAPLSGKPCLYWEVEAFNPRAHGDDASPLAHDYRLSDCAPRLRVRDPSGVLPIDTSFCNLVTRTQLRCNRDANPDFYRQLLRSDAPERNLIMIEQCVTAGPVWLCGKTESSSLGVTLGGENEVLISEVGPQELERAARWRRLAGAAAMLAGAALVGRAFV